MGLRNKERRLSPLHSELDALIWSMENMIQHTTCQYFRTDCKELILMVNDLTAWPGFSPELLELASLQERFQDFKIIHVPKA